MLSNRGLNGIVLFLPAKILIGERSDLNEEEGGKHRILHLTQCEYITYIGIYVPYVDFSGVHRRFYGLKKGNGRLGRQLGGR